MRVIVIGGTGTIGRAVVQALSARHEVVSVGRHTGDVQADLTLPDSVQRLLERVGEFDALISAAGAAAWKPLAELTEEDFRFSLSNKLMGQVNLIRLGMQRVRDGGSITVTSGVLAREPMPGSATVSLVNAGLEGFARAAALEAPRGVRINVVSPPWVTETLEAMGMEGMEGLPAETVARAYVQSVEGDGTGQVLDPRTLG